MKEPETLKHNMNGNKTYVDAPYEYTNSDYSKAPIIAGYYAEKKIMKKIDNECSHHQYRSIQLFIMHVHKLAFGTISAVSRISSVQFGDSFVKLIGAGFCKQRALHIVSNGEYLMKSDLFLSLIACYFAHCMGYRQIANFILNQSNLWIHMIDIHGTKLQTLPNIIGSDPKRCCYANVQLETERLVRNVKLFKPFHWKYIILNKTYFNQLLSFVQQQLQTGLYLKYPCGRSCMCTIFVFVCYIWYHMKYILQDYTRINEWINSLKLIIKQHDAESMEIDGWKELILSFTSLENDKYVTKMFYCWNSFVKKVHHLKWMDMQCQYGKCKKRRS
eukprot:91083_1